MVCTVYYIFIFKNCYAYWGKGSGQVKNEILVIFYYTCKYALKQNTYTLSSLSYNKNKNISTLNLPEKMWRVSAFISLKPEVSTLVIHLSAHGKKCKTRSLIYKSNGWLPQVEDNGFPGVDERKVLVLGLTGMEFIFFIAAHTVLCFGFVITHQYSDYCWALCSIKTFFFSLCSSREEAGDGKVVESGHS